MHIDKTPNRQSFPQRFISCNRVATQRVPITDTTVKQISLLIKDNLYTMLKPVMLVIWVRSLQTALLFIH